MIELIIEDALIYDVGQPRPFRGDLGVVGDRIALLGDLEDREAYERLDAGGLTLVPGFIDVHSHSDELWLANPQCASKILQGVTTEIGGNCGTSAAPLRGLALERKQEEARSYGLDVEWRELHEFFTLVEKNGTSLNVATLAGLGTTRRCVRGDREGRLEPAELRAECALVREAVEQGALGVSSGLVYTPSRHADLDELAACSAAARDAGAPRYATHLRDEGNALLEAVEEALSVASKAEVAVQFSHHKSAGKRNWGKVHRSLEAIERARAAGLPAHADVYPYTASWTDLATLLPEDALAGGREAVLERLRDPLAAAALALRLELDHGEEWHGIMLSTLASERNAGLAGLRLDELARRWRTRPARAVLRLLAEEGLAVEAIFFAMSEDDVAAVLSAGFTCIGSDASARALSGVTARGLPHPRTFGCFPRVFGRFVRGRKTLELGEAIRRMTVLPAEIFGLSGRGRIEVGAYADLVLFDPQRIVDTATYERPYAYPEGIDSVWVNGRAVVRRGALTGARPGRVLRGGK
ncbi:MAG: D-aminoacylase [Candidatus Baltobacteraceae bacterium]|jgi:N-acyl-D-amino-acid deacylase